MKTLDWVQWTSLCRLAIQTDDFKNVEHARSIIQDINADVERAISRWTPKSEISRINQEVLKYGYAEVLISKMLAEILFEAFVAYELTDGAYDPRVEDSLQAMGYGHRWEMWEVQLSEKAGIQSSLVSRPPLPKEAKIKMRNGSYVLHTQTTLDLTAVGKAFAADRGATKVANALESPVMLSLGGDIATAGAEYASTQNFGWSIDIQDMKTDPQARVEIIHNGAIATSSSQKRRWTMSEVEASTRFHHIIDPRTGVSATPELKTATVIADRATVANALSTAAIVWGTTAVEEIKIRQFPARIVTESNFIVHNLWPQNSEVLYSSC